MSTEASANRQNLSLSRSEREIATLDRLTLFAVPKPFHGHIGCIQRNAIRSWRQLGKEVEILLFGNEPGIEEMADDVGAVHIPFIARNNLGTPLLHDVFARAHEISSAKYLGYVNADIMLFGDVWTALCSMAHHDPSRFLLTGRRVDLDVTEILDFSREDWQYQLKSRLKRSGRLAPRVCKDYFLFTRNLFETIPAFAIGRGNWDNWMVHNTKTRGVPVVDATKSITALHQNHDYGHLKGNRRTAYVTGPEAKENQRLAGGSHIVSGACPNWSLRGNKLVQHSRLTNSLSFWLDMPRFLGLLSQLAKS